jgi:hypothetical protein
MPTAFAKGKAAGPKGVELPQGVQLLGPEDRPAPAARFKPVSEDEQFLFGPTQRPDESVFTGAPRGGAKNPPPPTLGRWLPTLLKAAERPDAPPELHAFIRRIRDALEED